MESFLACTIWNFIFLTFTHGLPIKSPVELRDQLSSTIQQQQQLLASLAQRRSGTTDVGSRNQAGALLPAPKMNEKGKARDWLENYEGGMPTQDSPEANFRYNSEQTGSKHQLMDFYGHQSQLHSLHSPVMHHTHTAHIYDPNFSAHLDYGGEEGFAGHGAADQGSRHPEAYPGEMIEDENTLSKYIAPPVFESNSQKNQVHHHRKFPNTPEEMMTEKTNTKSLIDSLNSMMTPLQDQVEHPEEYNAEDSERKEEPKSYQKSFRSRPNGAFDKYEVDSEKGVFKTSIEENGGYHIKSYDDREESRGTGHQHEYHHTHNEDVDSNSFHDLSDDRDRGQHEENSHYDAMSNHRYHDQGSDHGDGGSEERGGGHMGYEDEGQEETHQRSNYESKAPDTEMSSRIDNDRAKQFIRNKDTELDNRIEGSQHHAEQGLSEGNDRLAMPEQDSVAQREEPAESRIESREQANEQSSEQASEHPQLESREQSDPHADVRMERPERPRFQQDDEPNNEEPQETEEADREQTGGADADQKPIEVIQDEHEHHSEESNVQQTEKQERIPDNSTSD